MIFFPKDAKGTPKINRLRCIDAFDAELNLLRRELISHRTMRLAENEKQLTDNQWGGRRHTQCPDLSLQNELYKTAHTLTRHNGATTDVDASN